MKSYRNMERMIRKRIRAIRGMRMTPEGERRAFNRFVAEICEPFVLRNRHDERGENLLLAKSRQMAAKRAPAKSKGKKAAKSSVKKGAA